MLYMYNKYDGSGPCSLGEELFYCIWNTYCLTMTNAAYRKPPINYYCEDSLEAVHDDKSFLVLGVKLPLGII